MEHEKVIHETIRHIRNEKKKRPDSKLIIRTATANSGLTEGTIRSSFDYLVENGSIYSKTSDGKESFFIYDIDKLGVSDGESIGNCSETDSEKMEPDGLKFETDSVLEGINETSDNSASGTTRSEFFVLLDLISKLTDDVRDLNTKLEDSNKKNEKLLENNCFLKIENSKLRAQRNVKPSWDKSHEYPDSSVSCIGSPTDKCTMQLQKHNADAKNTLVSPESGNKKAAEMIQSQWDTCLEERKRKYQQHLAKVQMNASKKFSTNSEYKRDPVNNSDSAELSIVSEDINTPYARSILDKRKMDNKMQKKKRNKQNKTQKPSNSLTNNTPQAKENIENKSIENSSKSENNKSTSNKSNNTSGNNNNNNSNNLQSGNQRNQGSTTFILGDSIIKNVAAWRLRKRIKQNDRLFIHSFPGATISDMTSYCQPAIDKKPSNIILHCGTNDMNCEKSEVDIATEMLTLAHSIKAKGINVIISGLVRRGDILESKRIKTNAIIKNMCGEENMKYIEHNNIKLEHLNRSLLHLNKYGDSILANNFLTLLKE